MRQLQAQVSTFVLCRDFTENLNAFHRLAADIYLSRLCLIMGLKPDLYVRCPAVEYRFIISLLFRRYNFVKQTLFGSEFIFYSFYPINYDPMLQAGTFRFQNLSLHSRYSAKPFHLSKREEKTSKQLIGDVLSICVQICI